MLEQKKEIDGPVIIFDSACMLCTRSINFLLANEKSKIFLFTPLNGEYAKKLNISEKYNRPIPDSIILYDKGQVYVESTAALKACHWLRQPYRNLKYFLWIPSFIRDFVYRFIAKNRYKWFGTHADNCYWVPPDERHRFLD